MAYLQSMKKRWPILAGMAVFIVAGACMDAFGGLFLDGCKSRLQLVEHTHLLLPDPL